MNAKLEAYLKEKWAEEREERELLLIKLGLYEKVYAPDNEPSDEYYDFEGEGETRRCFKRVPIEVTPEEYAELLKYNPKPLPEKKNHPASFMTVLAWINYILGFLIGLGLFFGEGGFVAGFTIWLYAFIAGSVMLALSEMIKLLSRVNNKMDRVIND